MKKNRHRIKCMVVGSFADPERMIATTAALSHKQRTVIPFQMCPHTAQATIIGKSSLGVIWMSDQDGGH